MDDYGPLLFGLLLLAFFVGYLYGHRNGTRDQFERQTTIKNDKNGIMA